MDITVHYERNEKNHRYVSSLLQRIEKRGEEEHAKNPDTPVLGLKAHRPETKTFEFLHFTNLTPEEGKVVSEEFGADHVKTLGIKVDDDSAVQNLIMGEPWDQYDSVELANGERAATVRKDRPSPEPGVNPTEPAAFGNYDREATDTNTAEPMNSNEQHNN